MTGRVPDVILYVREGCHLCDAFLVDLSVEMGAAYGDLSVVDVDRDDGLATRFGLRVPVLEVAGEVACEGRYDAARVRRALRV